MFTSRPRNCKTNSAPKIRINPASATAFGVRRSIASASAFSKSKRSGKFAGLTHSAETPAWRAISSAGADGLSLKTAATLPRNSGNSKSRASCCRVPKPKQPRNFSREHRPRLARPRDNLADDKSACARVPQNSRGVLRVFISHNNREPDAAVKHAAHFLLVHLAGLLQEVKHWRARPRVAKHFRRQAGRNRARQVFRQSAAGDVRGGKTGIFARSADIART